MTATLLVISVAAGIGLGFSVSAQKFSAAISFGFGVVFFVFALAVYGTQCEGASMSDILLLRNVPGPVFCSGKFTFLAYACFIGALVILLRSAFAKRAPDV